MLNTQTVVYVVTGLASREDTGSSDDWKTTEVALSQKAAYRCAYTMIQDYVDGDFDNISADEKDIVEFLRLKNSGEHEKAIDLWNKSMSPMNVEINTTIPSVQEDCSDVEFPEYEV